VVAATLSLTTVAASGRSKNFDEIGLTVLALPYLPKQLIDMVKSVVGVP
jgi:hypothetical protein